MTNSLKPKIWGPHGWKFLHYVSLGYPEKPSARLGSGPHRNRCDGSNT